MLIPVAVLGAYLAREKVASIRATVVVLMCVWAAWTATDAVRVTREFVRSPPPNPHRELADYLVTQGIRYARGGYWDAYVVTFLAREQVVVASTEQVRISAYGALVDAHAAEAVTLARQPCEGERRVSVWCLE